MHPLLALICISVQNRKWTHEFHHAVGISKIFQLSLGPQYKGILFIHALLGWDTTSRIYGVGKAMALKLMKTSVHFQQQSAIFNSPAAKKEDIIKAGEQSITSLYRGEPVESLDDLRLQVLHKKSLPKYILCSTAEFATNVSGSQVPQSEGIPPSPTVVWSRSPPNRLGMENTRRSNYPCCHRSSTSPSLSAWGYPLQL